MHVHAEIRDLSLKKMGYAPPAVIGTHSIPGRAKLYLPHGNAEVRRVCMGLTEFTLRTPAHPAVKPTSEVFAQSRGATSGQKVAGLLSGQWVFIMVFHNECSEKKRKREKEEADVSTTFQAKSRGATYRRVTQRYAGYAWD